MKAETKKSFGNRGEESAASFLCGKGYEIVGRNIRIGHLEIDIIAKDTTHLIFAEVKTRTAYPDVQSRYGRPAVAVDIAKREKLYDGAKKYYNKHKEEFVGLLPRIDVLEVYVSPDSEKYKVLKIVHMQNAVTGENA